MKSVRNIRFSVTGIAQSTQELILPPGSRLVSAAIAARFNGVVAGDATVILQTNPVLDFNTTDINGRFLALELQVIIGGVDSGFASMSYPKILVGERLYMIASANGAGNAILGYIILTFE